jgi:hypothetical protein
VKIACAEGHSARAARSATRHALVAALSESAARRHAQAQKIIDCLDLGRIPGAAPFDVESGAGSD